MPVISIENVRKVFRVTEKQPGLAGSLAALFRPRIKAVTALDGVSFEVEAGEMVGYIGVNGAGKSTTIKILTGILVPTSGCVTVMGRDPSRERIANAAEIGVVFGQRSQLWWDLPLIESLDLVARIYELGTGRYRELLDEFTDTLDLGDLLKTPIREMSLGQKMRSELAATLIHEPKVVYLDEPTVGLDLMVKERIRQFIKRQNAERRTTVILTTHDLGDIEELCRRVIIIDAGRIVYDGPLAAIAARFGSYRTIAFETVDPAPELELPAGAELIDSGHAHRVALRFDRTHTTASRVAASVMSQVEVLDLSITEPDLASIVRQIYDGALEGKQ